LRRERGELGLVDVEADFCGFPFDSVNVEAFGEVFTTGEFCGRGEIGGGAVGERAVDRAVDGGGLFADVLHDVDFAALGPADRIDVVAEHPERGPDALAVRDFDAGLEAAESLRVEPLRFEASGRVFASDVVGAFVIFFACGDDEIAVFDVGVFRTICVGLEFVVTPATAAEVVSPFFRVGSGTVRAVEFVGPDQSEVFRRGLRGGGGFYSRGRWG
jgi:hypothetical protein